MSEALAPVAPTVGIAGGDAFERFVRATRGRDEERPGCPISAVRRRLRECGLRPTRQRLLLGWMLFGKGDRHVSAEELYAEATRGRAHLSLATVYNTLHQFTEAGLLRQVQAGPGKAYFDTNTSDHHHYIVEGEDKVFDVKGNALCLTQMPEAPAGFAVAGVDIIVRLRRLEPAEDGAVA